MEPPTLMIFLERSVNKLMDRIRERGRECEKDISTDYISQLNDYYSHWYGTYNLGKRIIIDTDDLDFLNNEDQFERLVQKIQDSMAQQDLFYSYH
jgi:deoxyadenosine/deoxycytidine kinase